MPLGGQAEDAVSVGLAPDEPLVPVVVRDLACLVDVHAQHLSYVVQPYERHRLVDAHVVRDLQEPAAPLPLRFGRRVALDLGYALDRDNDSSPVRLKGSRVPDLLVVVRQRTELLAIYV